MQVAGKDVTEVYAVPGKACMVDLVNPHTGRSLYGNRDDAEMSTEYPGAVRMAFDAWEVQAIAAQKTPVTWAPVTEERYDEMLNVLPPALWVGGAFMVGEPVDHDVQTGAPRFQAYRALHGKHYEASRPQTRAEFRTFLGIEAKS